MSDPLTIRDWQQADMPVLLDMHMRMNPGYLLPEQFGPLFCVRKAVIDENGRIVGMATLKLIGEAFLWVDQGRTSEERKEAINTLMGICSAEARILGLEDCSAWVPPKFQRFAKTVLKRLKWKRSPWRSWSRVL